MTSALGVPISVRDRTAMPEEIDGMGDAQARRRHGQADWSVRDASPASPTFSGRSRGSVHYSGGLTEFASEASGEIGG